MVLQRRGDFGEKYRQNFSEPWAVYKRGFGDPQREFWIGNDKMHALTTQDDVKLRVRWKILRGNSAYAEYTRFKVADEKKNYKISVGGYHGNATDSLSLHDGKLFSTIDRDNDEVAACCNCADTFGGGWWYYRCFEANLNGPYQTDQRIMAISSESYGKDGKEIIP
ncbi:techylectin-5A [Caerostris extrusa]|uniref:Techylectin-5A n=1 Tax=Caerostris extrusa TaxID=172846 RepID=A0AAV4YC26_CAEEX|nr:techylectin-5A [Caerostris extrusa]